MLLRRISAASAERLLEKISGRVGDETLIAWEENPVGTKAKFVIAGPGTGEIAAMDYRIATITTDLGHTVAFSYYDNLVGSWEGRLKSIEDEDNRIVNYAYDSGGQGATVMRGRVTEYVYSPSIVQQDRAPSHPLEHNLIKVGSAA